MGGADPLAPGGAAWGRGPSSGGSACQVGRGPQLDPMEDGGSRANEAGFGGGGGGSGSDSPWMVQRARGQAGQACSHVVSFFLFYLLWRATGPPR